MRLPLILLGILLLQGVYSNGTAEEECLSLNLPVQKLNSGAGSYLHIFVDLKLTCTGFLHGWNYYAYRTGPFYADIWRPSGGQYKLLAKYLINAKTEGNQFFEVPEGEKVEVVANDVIGIHYSESSIGVIPYEDSRNNQTQTVNTELSHIMNAGMFDSSLPVGKTLDLPLHSAKRLPALKPIIGGAQLLSSKECMSLSPPVQALNTPAGPWLNVFVDLKVVCSGILSGWNYYANKTGPFYADIWRPTGPNYTLVAKFLIDAKNEGIQYFAVPIAEQIFVEADDVIGIHYQTSNSTGIVPYEQSDEPRIVEGTLSHIMNEGIYDSSLPVGQTEDSPPRSFKRLPALKPAIEGANSACLPHSAPIQQLNGNPGSYLNIFTNTKLTCGGVLLAWKFYANRTGTFYADIWRKNLGYDLVAKYRITATTTGEQTFIIPASERVTVEEVDVIGIHYPNISASVVPYEESRLTLCCGFTFEDLSPIINSGMWDSDLPLNKTVQNKLIPSVHRLPALLPIISTVYEVQA